MSEDETTSKTIEALLPHCRMARIHGKWVKGGRYYRALAYDVAVALAIMTLGFAIDLLILSGVR
jgi:hypothetical protein